MCLKRRAVSKALPYATNHQRMNQLVPSLINVTLEY